MSYDSRFERYDGYRFGDGTCDALCDTDVIPQYVVHTVPLSG